MGNERFNRALRAMKAIGLSTSVVSPVLKHLLKVIKVEHILNKMLQKRYENAKVEFAKHMKSVREMLVFHGTDKDAIEKIIEEGFKIGGQGVAVRNGRAYGKGVYTALDPNISIGYSEGEGRGMILLSSALVGKKGVDYKEGRSGNVLVLKKSEYLLPKYIVHYRLRGASHF